MKMSRTIPGLVALVLLTVTAALAQEVTVEGRAYGSLLSLGGVPLAPAADTGPQSASCSSLSCADNTFDVSTAGQFVDASPVAQVLSDASSTEGEADDEADATLNNSHVTSAAGDSVGIFFPGAAGGAHVLEVSTSGAALDLRCGVPPAHASSLVLVVVAGTPVPIPGDSEATVIEGLPLLRFNRRECITTSGPTAGRGSIECTSEALRAQLVQAGELVDVSLSNASGALRDVPLDCICPDQADCFACRNFSGSEIDGGFVENDDCPSPTEGDRLEFEILAENQSLEECEALDVTMVARVPGNLTIDESSVTVDGEPAVGTVGPCPESLAFVGCTGEAPTDGDRDCLTVPLGVIAPGESAGVGFEADVTRKDAVCLSAKLTAPFGEDQEVRTIEDLVAILPDGDCPGVSPGGGDILATTGSGGCSTVPGAPAGAEDLGLAALALGWLARRRRTR
jgi:MYXO-CTERM domain-containing protein